MFYKQVLIWLFGNGFNSANVFTVALCKRALTSLNRFPTAMQSSRHTPCAVPFPS